MAFVPHYRRVLRLILSEGDFSSSRRRFLKNSTLASGAAVLGACTTFDRWMMGDNNHLDREVMVLGGGLAGLTAAYQLKKSKIPYKVYEASSRLGGRVQTLNSFNSDQQFAEAGAEFFEGNHKLVLQMCKDLNLTAQDISFENKKGRALYWLEGKIIDEKEFRHRLKPLASHLAQLHQEFFSGLPNEVTPASLLLYPRTAEMDALSLGDVLNSMKGSVPAGVLQSFATLCVSEWGVEVNRINLMQFLMHVDFEERAMSQSNGKIYRVEGGNSRLISVLGERVRGVIPGLLLKMEHRLVAITNRSDGYDCVFSTPQGNMRIWARQIICTLPWTMLKEVEGVQNLNIGRYKHRLIQNPEPGTHSKVISSFREPLWKKGAKGLPAHQGIFRGELIGQNYWDSSRGQVGTHGLITSQRGGETGKNTGDASPSETVQDLRHFYKDLAGEESSEVVNWLQKPFAKGSRQNFGPGVYISFLSALVEEDLSSIYMAGEHLSFRESGTMNGAMETAMIAASRALEKAFFKGPGDEQAHPPDSKI